MVNRHSSEPQEIIVPENVAINRIKVLINESILEKMNSVAVLCENKDIQIKLESLLNDINDINLYVLPVYNAKGLEFDSVIIYDDGFGKMDKKLYYVACTRALHKLNILKIDKGRI